MSSGVARTSISGRHRGEDGVSWQVVPRGFYEVMNGSDKAAVQRAFDAMLTMKKLDLAALEAAAADAG